MPLDPNIPMSAVSPQSDATSAVQAGANLKGTQQQNQMRQYQLQELVRKQGVMKDLQGVASNYDLQSQQGRSGFLGEAAKRDLGTFVELSSSFNNLNQQDAVVQDQKDKIFANGVYGLMQKYNNLLAKGPGNVKPEEAQALTQEYRAFIKSAMDNKLKPDSYLGQAPTTPDISTLHTALMTSPAGRELLKAEMTEREEREKERHNRSMEQKGGGRWLASQDEKGNPTWVWAPNPGSSGAAQPTDKPPGVGGEPAKTGPQVPARAPGARPSAVTQRYNQRSITAGAEVVRGLSMIDQMPVGQTAGVFQKYHGDGIISAPMKALTQSMTSQDAIDYNTAFSGVALELTTLLRNGMNLNEVEIKGIEEGAKAVPGDSVGNVLYKIANVAAKARTALDSFEPSSEQQKKERDQLLKELNKWPDPEQVYAKIRGQKVPAKKKDIVGERAGIAPETSQTVEDQADDFSHLWEGR